MTTGIGLTKPDRVVSWKQQEVPRVKKKPPVAAADDQPTVREILDGGATPSVVVEPLPPSPDDPGLCGTVLLVPNGQTYYFPLVYIGGEEGSVAVALPPVQGILVMDLPKGMFTSQKEINDAIDAGTGGGPPGTVGPS